MHLKKSQSLEDNVHGSFAKEPHGIARSKRDIEMSVTLFLQQLMRNNYTEAERLKVCIQYWPNG